MSITVRPTTAEIAASIDGFYDDFADRSNAEIEIAEDDADSLSIEEETPDHLSPTKKARQEHAFLIEENIDLCRRSKLALIERAQGRKKPPSDASKINETETRFRSSLKQWPQILNDKRDIEVSYGNRIDQLKEKREEKRTKVQEIKTTFVNFCTKISKDLLKGDKTAIQEVDSLLRSESDAAEEMHRLRLESVRLDSQKRRIEKRMADRDRLGDGLYLMDFEQLKIENQALNEKIDERHQELVQLKKKTSAVVQVLTHVREKLHFVRGRVVAEREELEKKATDLGSKKANLQDIKRVCLKQENRRHAIDRQCLRVTDTMLLKDIEDLKKEKISLKAQLSNLKTVWASIE